jgi:hypothetical protein
MEIYVQTRGIDRETGYEWHQVVQGQPDRLREPELLSRVGLDEYRDPEAHSMLLGRHEGRLYVYISGLKSQHRTVLGGPIQNRVLWLEERQASPEIEQLLVQTAADILDPTELNRLEARIDEALKQRRGNPLSFCADWNLLLPGALLQGGTEAGLPKSDTTQSGQYAPPLRHGRIERNTDESRKQLRQTLTTCRLPTKDGLFVVVTELVSPAKLQHADVMRGLTAYDAPPKPSPLKKTVLRTLVVAALVVAGALLLTKGVPWRR